MSFVFTLIGCSSPETRAGKLALKFASLPLDDASGQHLLACADDQAAKSVDELKADYAAATGGLLGALVTKQAELDAKATRSVKSTTLNAAKDTGSVVVTVAVPNADGTSAETTVTVAVRSQGDGWCVVTGWAEQKRIAEIAAEAETLAASVVPLVKDWKLEEAEGAIAKAAAKAAELPDTQPRRTLIESTLTTQREVLAARKAGWVGGRWRVTDEKDPMTDDHNVVVSLESVDGLPGRFGPAKPASLLFRCKRNRLEVYVATDTMLDSDWRYDSVSGQHRFGSDPAERLVGTVSSDREAVFLRGPRVWMDQFLAREADGWTVELPVYGRAPASVRFDLTAASKALPAIPDTCK